jgi:hypothetical protein
MTVIVGATIAIIRNLSGLKAPPLAAISANAETLGAHEKASPYPGRFALARTL